MLRHTSAVSNYCVTRTIDRAAALSNTPEERSRTEAEQQRSGEYYHPPERIYAGARHLCMPAGEQNASLGWNTFVLLYSCIFRLQ
jgi:hypothetical protein